MLKSLTNWAGVSIDQIEATQAGRCIADSDSGYIQPPLAHRTIARLPATLRNGMKTWQRYWLLQLPGLAILLVMLFIASRWYAVPVLAGWIMVIGWIIKDIAMYPLLKGAFEGSKPTGVAVLIGSRGTATEDLRPRGYVRVGPELWWSQSTTPVGRGVEVQVIDCEGMMLLVEPVHSEAVAESGAPPPR